MESGRTVAHTRLEDLAYAWQMPELQICTHVRGLWQAAVRNCQEWKFWPLKAGQAHAAASNQLHQSLPQPAQMHASKCTQGKRGRCKAGGSESLGKAKSRCSDACMTTALQRRGHPWHHDDACIGRGTPMSHACSSGWLWYDCSTSGSCVSSTNVSVAKNM